MAGNQNETSAILQEFLEVDDDVVMPWKRSTARLKQLSSQSGSQSSKLSHAGGDDEYDDVGGYASESSAWTQRTDSSLEPKTSNAATKDRLLQQLVMKYDLSDGEAASVLPSQGGKSLSKTRQRDAWYDLAKTRSQGELGLHLGGAGRKRAPRL